MDIYVVEGDLDYLIAHCWQKGETDRLMWFDEGGAELDYSISAKIGFHAEIPETEGVETDCPAGAVPKSLVLSARAIEALRPMLEAAGRIMPIEPPHPAGYALFVCTCVVDALIEEESDVTRFDSGRVWDIKRYALRRALLDGVDVFRLRDRRVELFVSDRFVRAVERHRLTGFKTAKVWSDEGGGIVIDPKSPFGDPRPWLIDPKTEPARLRAKRAAMRALIAARDKAG